MEDGRGILTIQHPEFRLLFVFGEFAKLAKFFLLSFGRRIQKRPAGHFISPSKIELRDSYTRLDIHSEERGCSVTSLASS